MRTLVALLLLVVCAPAAHADPELVHSDPLDLRHHWEDWTARFDGQVRRYADDRYQVVGELSGKCNGYRGTVRVEYGLSEEPWKAPPWLPCDSQPMPFDTGRLPITRGQGVLVRLCLAGEWATRCRHPVTVDTWT